MFTKLYALLFVAIIFVYHIAFASGVFLLSLLLALVPFARTKWIFGLPIIWLVWGVIKGYDSFVIWSLIFIPFHYIAWMSTIVGIIKKIFNADKW